MPLPLLPGGALGGAVVRAAWVSCRSPDPSVCQLLSMVIIVVAAAVPHSFAIRSRRPSDVPSGVDGWPVRFVAALLLASDIFQAARVH